VAGTVVDHNHDYDHGRRNNSGRGRGRGRGPVCCRFVAPKPQPEPERKLPEKIKGALSPPTFEQPLRLVKFQTRGRVCVVNVDSAVNCVTTLFVPMPFPILFPHQKRLAWAWAWAWASVLAVL
jgi:hypothetical protein